MNDEHNLPCPISGEFPKEELLNYWTHLLGFFLSLIGLVMLGVYAGKSGNSNLLISSLVYGGTLVLLYAASTCYHGCKKIHYKGLLKVFDHACIYLLIAGSYTPFAIGPLFNEGGVTLLYIEWGIATIGIAFKLFDVNRFTVLSLVSYLVMGWLVVFSVPTLLEVLPTLVLALMLVGGAFYTLGTIFFVWESLPFNHTIWHLFVLGGSICHYFAILLLAIE